MAHDATTALSSRLPSGNLGVGRMEQMAKPPRRVSEPGRDNHTWNDERAQLVRTRLAYLRTYSEQFQRLFGKSPSESDLERAVEQYEPDQGFPDASP